MTDVVLNLTIIGDRSCSTTRTYLTYLRAAGYRVHSLWLVDFTPQSSIRTCVRHVITKISSLFLGKPRHEKRFEELCLAIQSEAGYTPINHSEPWNPFDYANNVKEFRSPNFNDPKLHARMVGANGTAFLYTNGGRVPGKLLEDSRIKMLHIHPGIVPDMRGSDCLLWSAIVRKKLGVSCFYMSAGIDEGSLISQREFAIPRLASLAPFLERGEELIAYRALTFGLDPHLRARLLIDVVRGSAGKDLRSLSSRPQGEPVRPAYLWMHSRLRLKVMKAMFL